MTRALDEASFDRNPVITLQRWIADAAAANVVEPNAMSLATANAQGRPSVRIVLLRGLDERGLRFYTSYFSRKGRELEANPFAAAAFYWPQLERQARVEGPVHLLSEDESDRYFASRPRGHQLGAWASEQTEPVASRAVLDERYAHFEQRFAGGEVPRPHSWGGYALVPERLEFWQRRINRMHDRFEYRLEGGLWEVRRLQP
jgi:pyridoxamine 5'-phosphate oxidase